MVHRAIYADQNTDEASLVLPQDMEILEESTLDHMLEVLTTREFFDYPARGLKRHFCIYCTSMGGGAFLPLLSETNAVDFLMVKIER